MRILVVEDEPKLADIVRRGLVERGHAVDLAGTGEDAVWMAAATVYEAIVLDVMLPGIDGFEVCRRLRAEGVASAILMLTARDALDDRIRGLDTGADDYLTKPFSLAELAARLRALGRRGPIEAMPVLCAGDLRLDPSARRVTRAGIDVPLSPRALAVLEALMRRPGRLLSRFELLEAAWDGSYENRSNVVDVYVRRVRDAIDRPFGTDTIETVRGVGYRFQPGGGR